MAIEDLSILASNWQNYIYPICDASNKWCNGADINMDFSVDQGDLSMLAANWHYINCTVGSVTTSLSTSQLLSSLSQVIAADPSTEDQIIQLAKDSIKKRGCQKKCEKYCNDEYALAVNRCREMPKSDRRACSVKAYAERKSCRDDCIYFCKSII